MAIDYQQIIEDLNDEKVLNLMVQLGCEDYEEKSDCFIFHTICHNEDAAEASKKLYYYKNTHLFYCYSECGAMSIFTFLKHYYETRGVEYDWFSDILQVILDCSFNKNDFEFINRYKSQRINYEPKKIRKELDEIPIERLDYFSKYYPIEWLNDGISKEAMDKYNILYSIQQNKIIIPHYDINSRLIGIRGRALNEWEVENVGKYMPIQIGQTWYSHPLSLNLYGLNKTKDSIKENGICFLVESEKSVLQAESFNMPNCCAAVCGSKINKYHIDLLMRYCAPKEIVICFDNEEIHGESNYFNKLYEMAKKYTNYCNMSFIYDRKGITNLKDSPTDRGEDVFKTLLNERVRVK